MGLPGPKRHPKNLVHQATEEDLPSIPGGKGAVLAAE